MAGTGKDHPLFPLLKKVWKAQASARNARSRASSYAAAYRALAESGWDGYEGDHLSIDHYADALDHIVWPTNSQET